MKKYILIAALLLFVIASVYFWFLGPKQSLEFFEENYARMTEVVELAKNNSLKVLRESHLGRDTTRAPIRILRLPWRYRDLSRHGKIYFLEDEGVISIVFVVSKDWEARASGFLYQSDDGRKKTDFYWAFKMGQRIKENWFTSGFGDSKQI